MSLQIPDVAWSLDNPQANKLTHAHAGLVETAFSRFIAASDAALAESGNDFSKARLVIIQAAKELRREAYAALEAQLTADRDGRACAIAIAHFYDRLVQALIGMVTATDYRSSNPSQAENMAVVATGGYGRGLMAPHSDIDILFLLPYKLTSWGESIIEALLYTLWDIGLKVGHATRTIPQCVQLARSDMTIRTSLLDTRLIIGNAALFSQFRETFTDQVVRGTAVEFVDAKLSERDARHKASGSSRYLVEPNVKDGK
ncbi:MAG: nucleotidyltransferase domain-containing protein, partial [Pseudomonadota bacterium]